MMVEPVGLIDTWIECDKEEAKEKEQIRRAERKSVKIDPFNSTSDISIDEYDC